MRRFLRRVEISLAVIPLVLFLPFLALFLHAIWGGPFRMHLRDGLWVIAEALLSEW